MNENFTAFPCITAGVERHGGFGSSSGTWRTSTKIYRDGGEEYRVAQTSAPGSALERSSSVDRAASNGAIHFVLLNVVMDVSFLTAAGSVGPTPCMREHMSPRDNAASRLRVLPCACMHAFMSALLAMLPSQSTPTSTKVLHCEHGVPMMQSSSSPLCKIASKQICIGCTFDICPEREHHVLCLWLMPLSSLCHLTLVPDFCTYTRHPLLW